MVFQRSIALNEIICLPAFVLTRGLYKFCWVAYPVLGKWCIVIMDITSVMEGVAKYIR